MIRLAFARQMASGSSWWSHHQPYPQSLRSAQDFFPNGFMYIHALAKFVMLFCCHDLFYALVWSIGLILGAVIVAVIFRLTGHFDSIPARDQ
ncbi:MAG: hypothetical protein IPF93_15235 [Saprospiraceae bacterium]|nr:hypothetical protein [Saprospiraceae bacterium]